MLKRFEKQKYLNLETFRRNGEGMKTPVWFVQAGDVLYVRTVANSGKVKRVRNNGRVNIAPCQADGALLGEWVPARAEEIHDQQTDRLVDRLLDQKYGIQKKLFGLMARLQGRKDTILKIQAGG